MTDEKHNTVGGNRVGQERRTHSSVAAAVLVRPLPAMDINTSQKSQSQSKRLNRCDLFGFQCLADLFELSCVLQHGQKLQPASELRVN